MLILIKLFTWFCITYGIYETVVGKFKLPSRSVNRAVKAYSLQLRKEQNFNVLVQTLTGKIVPYVKMNDYKRSRMESDLRTMNVDVSPELFQATSIAKALLVLLGIIPCLVLFPILSIGVVFAALVVLNQDENELKKKLRKKREAIEYELPRFVCTIKQELEGTRDVLAILDSYKKNAGDILGSELEITTADMRSGNYEAALLRLEGRIASPILSDIIRGLLGTLRGDDNQAYFQMLSHDLDELEIQRLKAIAGKQPDKIKKYSFLLLVCAITLYLVVLCVYAYLNSKGII